MRNYGRRLKNLAALCLLLALLSLLLPFFKVEQGGNAQTVEVSGWDVVTSVTKLSVHYLQKGTIEKDYVVKGDLTWQEVCQAYRKCCHKFCRICENSSRRLQKRKKRRQTYAFTFP
mgnify:CR=1 FL=1